MKRSFLISLLLGAALLAGCDKAEDGLLVCDPVEPGVASLAAFYKLFAAPVQVVEVNSNQTQTVKLLDGSSIVVPAGSFVLPSGTPAAGTVELRVQVLGTTPQMVLNSLPSSSFFRPLEAGGHIRITARQGSSALRLRTGRFLTVNTLSPANSSASDQLAWRGVGTASGGVTVAWSQDTVPVRTISTASGERYFQRRVWTDSLGWFSVGRLWTSNPADTTLLRADVGGDASARVFLLPTQRSGAFLMKWNTQTRLMELYGVPPSTELNVLTLRSQNGQLLLGVQRATVRRGLVLRPTLEVVAPEQAAALIRLQ
ncbi:hypothetical protein LJ737_20480 [Hymenobacter sp. 15J16-1T3B]|uniref:hypothetical protein n=1 Tax=Hymenobacter sp. 15J16-1T3B TaxID=2886941 RepID=UPI001D116182|nr:hypothetical protein [Hymenobacter sp. 15J16-1T3B]MCC3159630.1 hypothetical protein [Hymenobacter sp. 15J16-1T3B]